MPEQLEDWMLCHILEQPEPHNVSEEPQTSLLNDHVRGRSEHVQALVADEMIPPDAERLSSKLSITGFADKC